MEKLGFAMIVDEIFTRLPTKAIGRLKCFSKDFRNELSTHMFKMMHSCRIGNSLHKKFLSLQDMSFFVDNVLDGVTSKTITFPDNVHPTFLHILASFNGLLLVCNEQTCCQLILWNPTTRRHKLLSDSYFGYWYDQNCDTGGMYFDETNDLKVLHIKCSWNVVTAHVYSRRRETWRKIDFLSGTNFGTHVYSWSPRIYSGKTIYFVFSQKWCPPLENYIVAFDVIFETYRILRFPESMEVNPWQGHFLSIAKKLHLIVVGMSPELTDDLLKFEDEVWIKVFSINSTHISDYEERREWTNNHGCKSR
ncbi:hypothetical protein HanXRQr2_Chr01g0009471 [Helianthus annuus]|uniref:F-box associated beta-propeller type 1 domain-containing protein n=1 Tax=Helianthus annuus TaxID=4232 RepID=A0A9K3JTD7_HELAN|nr:hypothetical protein HanXRQr2_Chr01g0009471 [Helianthus annuus]KAJ0610790.1 hypothetical protein HanHA300_Chr01g0007791 [Helianthus annuus]KAJ0621598.1 hypothetical protein HanIR_Chr01g0010521 [Helianthus annuus]